MTVKTLRLGQATAAVYLASAGTPLPDSIAAPLDAAFTACGVVVVEAIHDGLLVTPAPGGEPLAGAWVVDIVDGDNRYRQVLADGRLADGVLTPGPTTRRAVWFYEVPAA